MTSSGCVLSLRDEIQGLDDEHLNHPLACVKRVVLPRALVVPAADAAMARAIFVHLRVWLAICEWVRRISLSGYRRRFRETSGSQVCGGWTLGTSKVALVVQMS